MYGETPYMGSRLVKGLKKSPRCVMHRGLCYVESKSKNIFFYLFTFKEQPRWLNIPLGFFTFLLFYL